ncbi:MAG: FABP family protein [Ancrocorticia sp.]|jgi:hypothetical protein|nr:FABP family protein [Ancrocorticia sp.]MCI1962574.1 FABP family protein [Ancrocorticia sp.]MCI2002497.1 FABP family protein [Ancrocorticia sp.]MCI2012805.1 FABP family protein [Ancrocorticia sp.]MCI2178431.1 FABP family protein [Ancrocorticia sp.]
MVFQIPENLAPECYPMAWLVDTWRGAGVLEYENVEAAAYLHEVVIDNDDSGPYLRVRSNVWLAKESAATVDKEVPGQPMYDELTKGELWSSLTGFLRATPGVEKRDGATLLEATTCSPAGHAITWAGVIKGPQFQLAADAIAATPTASEFTAARLLGGLVHSDLFVAYDMAAFGHEMRSYMAGRLSRAEAE